MTQKIEAPNSDGEQRIGQYCYLGVLSLPSIFLQSNRNLRFGLKSQATQKIEAPNRNGEYTFHVPVVQAIMYLIAICS